MARLRASDARLRAESGRSSDFSEALARGIAVLTAFDSGRRQATLADLARVVDLPRATVRRALYTLAALGYVESDGRLYRLTPKVLTLAGAYLLSNPVSTILQPTCDRLCAEFREAVSCAVLDGEEIVMLAHASPDQLLRTGVGAGFRLPAHCTALGRVLLAALPDAALDRFLERLDPTPLTPATITDKALLREAVLAARARGYALVDQEAQTGFRSIAVPVRRYDGTVVAAMNVGLRIEHASVEVMESFYLDRLRRAAAEIDGQIL